MLSGIDDTLLACVNDAVDLARNAGVVTELQSPEGRHFLVSIDETPRAIVCCVDVAESPFEDLLRAQLQQVAARSQAPYMIITSFRSTVLFRTEEVMKAAPMNMQVVMQVKGADVFAVDEVLISAHRVRVTESLKKCLLAAQQGADVKIDVDTFVVERITKVLDDMIACTSRDERQVSMVQRLGSSVIGYHLLCGKDPEVDDMELPRSTRSGELLLDIVCAYLRDARSKGHSYFIGNAADLVVLSERQRLFSSSLRDLIRSLHEFDLSRLSDVQRRQIVDGMLQWCSRSRAIPIPTIDAIDLGLAAGGVLDISHTSRPTILEIGSSMGLVGIRAKLLLPLATSALHATNDVDERSILIRSLGQADNRDAQTLVARDAISTHEWDIVSISLSKPESLYDLPSLLEGISISQHGCLLLFLPTRVLRDEVHAPLREALITRFDVQWLFASDAEPLTEPLQGICLFVARPLTEEVTGATSFAFIRAHLSTLIPPAENSRSFSIERAERLRILLRYLTTSPYGKVNEEVVVRRIDRESLLFRTTGPDPAWDDLLIPPDVTASIIRKLFSRMRPLDTVASVSGGIRTGANDVLAPSVKEIVDAGLEEEYAHPFVTALEELESICGIPDCECRILLLPEDRSTLVGSNILAWLQLGESKGVPDRPTVRQRHPWWSLGKPPIPDLIIPKQQQQRWLVSTNAARAHVTDSFIEVCLNGDLDKAELSDRLALWMNSSLGLFMSELVQRSAHVADITVRDAQEFPIPLQEILEKIDVKRHRDFLYRPMMDLDMEFGTDDADIVRASQVQRDRRRLDRFFMEDVFALTEEEQQWVYRFALAWRSSANNIRHLANALATEIMLRHRLRPLREWYGLRIEQLPTGTSRTIIVPVDIDRAEAAQSMFAYQVMLYKKNRQDDVLECSSIDEAELITLLIHLGKRNVEIPTDLQLIREVLPIVQRFSSDLIRAIAGLTSSLPTDIRDNVADEIRAVFLT